MDYPVDCECGNNLLVTESSAGAILKCSCGRDIRVPSLTELRAGTSPAPFAVGSEGSRVDDPERSANAASWLPWVWIAGGAYMLVQSGWPPRALVFSVAYCVAIAIGIGLWFVERYEAFQPWRVVIWHVSLGLVLAALAATLGWELVAWHAGR